ncbi:MAG: CBS domain-containing protein [Candidatus Altiarchaeota archaeon]|nr:CBS domain-containing protein [Candidatus Altiarchaeota archaeon]
MLNTAKEIMHRHTFVPEDATVRDVAKLMTQRRIGSVLVKTKRGIGILTERDITGKVVIEALDPNKMKAGDIMTFPVKTVEADAEIYEVCGIFSENDFRRLPVVENGQVIGIITTRDIVKQFVPELVKNVYHFKDFRF